MTLTLIVLAVLAAVVATLATWLLRGYLAHRGPRLITCPETQTHEAVVVDAGHAALTTLLGRTELRLADCTRWPERRLCGQSCLAQIQAAPDGCLIRSIVARWYEGKTCLLCGRSVSEREWLEHEPALIDLRDPRRPTRAWRDVPPEKILEVLATHGPVCWNCHIVETFRREHPDLVLERPPVETSGAPPSQR
jgi:hypothetical protein